MQTRMKRTRGAAAVETAIMMVFLVPTFMYVLFLQDLLWYKLEQEETVVSTPWDYTALDWTRFNMPSATTPSDNNDDEAEQPADNSPAYKPDRNETESAPQEKAVDEPVAHQSRRTYCDHTSAYDSMDPTYECGTAHHTNYTAHQCWLTGRDHGSTQKGQQVTCWRADDSAVALSAVAIGGFNKGGLVYCQARLGVVNYFLPNKFFSFWSRADVTSLKTYEKQQNGTITQTTHTDSQSAEDGQAIVFIPQTAGMLQDTWALNWPKAVNPSDSATDSAFGSRMNAYYTVTQLAGAQAMALGAQLVSDKLLGPAALVDGLGDTVLTPPLAWKEDADRKFDDFGTSGWNDQRQQDAYNNRQNSYFGQNNYDVN